MCIWSDVLKIINVNQITLSYSNHNQTSHKQKVVIENIEAAHQKHWDHVMLNLKEEYKTWTI